MIRGVPRQSRIYHGLRQVRNLTVIVRRRLRYVHRTAFIHPQSRVAVDLRAERFAFVGPGCRIPPLVRIGQYSMLAADVAIVGDDHNWGDPEVPMQFADRPVQQPTAIGADVWLGHGVVLMRGLTVGDGAIVAAGAVVTHDVPPCEIWAGVPARKLRDRFTAAQRRTHQEMLSRPHITPRFAADPAEVATRHD